jgi:hypothetical protein
MKLLLRVSRAAPSGVLGALLRVLALPRPQLRNIKDWGNIVEQVKAEGQPWRWTASTFVV